MSAARRRETEEAGTADPGTGATASGGDTARKRPNLIIQVATATKLLIQKETRSEKTGNPPVLAPVNFLFFSCYPPVFRSGSGAAAVRSPG
jgi:hypothetical protein